MSRDAPVSCSYTVSCEAVTRYKLAPHHTLKRRSMREGCSLLARSKWMHLCCWTSN